LDALCEIYIPARRSLLPGFSTGLKTLHMTCSSQPHSFCNSVALPQTTRIVWGGKQKISMRYHLNLRSFLPSPPPPTPFLANIPRPTILTLVLNVHDPHSANSMKPILDEQWPAWPTGHLSRKTATTFGRWTIPELSTSHIGKGVALVAQTAAFVYIYVRISQIGEMTLSFHATPSAIRPRSIRTSILSSESSTHLLELVSELTMVRKRKERVVCSAQHHEEQERRRESQRTTVNL